CRDSNEPQMSWTSNQGPRRLRARRAEGAPRRGGIAMARGWIPLVTLGLALTSCATKVTVSGFADPDAGTGGDNAPRAVDAGGGSPPPGGGDASATPPLGGGSDDGGSDACVKVSDTETKCDGRDDDCNGKIDDVDVGHDGICDCIRIGLIGKKGWYASNN